MVAVVAFNVAIVAAPETWTSLKVANPIVAIPDTDKFLAVEVPVTPNVPIVAIPEELIFENKLAEKVPEEILAALIEVTPAPDPTKDFAVIMPDVLTLPSEEIPSPYAVPIPPGLLGLPPICNVNAGFVVAIPTFPLVAYMLL